MGNMISSARTKTAPAEPTGAKIAISLEQIKAWCTQLGLDSTSNDPNELFIAIVQKMITDAVGPPPGTGTALHSIGQGHVAENMLIQPSQVGNVNDESSAAAKDNADGSVKNVTVAELDLNANLQNSGGHILLDIEANDTETDKEMNPGKIGENANVEEFDAANVKEIDDSANVEQPGEEFDEGLHEDQADDETNVHESVSDDASDTETDPDESDYKVESDHHESNYDSDREDNTEESDQEINDHDSDHDSIADESDQEVVTQDSENIAEAEESDSYHIAEESAQEVIDQQSDCEGEAIAEDTEQDATTQESNQEAVQDSEDDTAGKLDVEVPQEQRATRKRSSGHPETPVPRRRRRRFQ